MSVWFKKVEHDCPQFAISLTRRPVFLHHIPFESVTIYASIPPPRACEPVQPNKIASLPLAIIKGAGFYHPQKGIFGYFKGDMKKYILGFGVLAMLLFLMLFVGGCNSYNNLVGLSQETDKQWAQVQSVYQRRADLIPNLVQTVSGAANFEKSTLTEITQARASVGQVKVNPNGAPADTVELEKFEKAQGQLSSALSRLLVVAERYPDLKATTNFRDLQSQLEGTENRITVERQRFNQVVQHYNTAVKRFPTVLFASMLGFQPKPYFSATAGAENPPKVEFNFDNKPK
jgi:LemA protein